MLYDPKWENKTPSLEGFIAWLETKDPEEIYRWMSYQTCAAGRYCKALGLHPSGNDIVRELSLIAHPGAGPCKFGDCLTRARAALMSRNT